MITKSLIIQIIIKMNQNNNLIFELGRMIGLTNEYLNKINNEYIRSNKDRRYQIMEFLWKGFFNLLKDITNIMYRQFLAEVALGKRKLESDLYQQAQQEAKNYLLKTLSGKIEDERKIEEIRQKISTFTQIPTN